MAEPEPVPDQAEAAAEDLFAVRVVLTHSTHCDGLMPVIERLRKDARHCLKTIILERLSNKSNAVSETFQLEMQRRSLEEMLDELSQYMPKDLAGGDTVTVTDYRCVAKNGSQRQDVFLVARQGTTEATVSLAIQRALEVTRKAADVTPFAAQSAAKGFVNTNAEDAQGTAFAQRAKQQKQSRANKAASKAAKVKQEQKVWDRKLQGKASRAKAPSKYG